MQWNFWNLLKKFGTKSLGHSGISGNILSDHYQVIEKPAGLCRLWISWLFLIWYFVLDFIKAVYLIEADGVGGAVRFLVVGTIGQEERPPQGQLWMEQCLTSLKYWPI